MFRANDPRWSRQAAYEGFTERDTADGVALLVCLLYGSGLRLLQCLHPSSCYWATAT